MTAETPVFAGSAAEALCLTEDADWETIAKKLGGRLGNREIADTGEYEALLIVPASPETPRIACLCGSTRFYDQFQQANYDLTLRGEIVLSVGFYPHAKTGHGHGEGVGHDSAEKTALDELHKRKIDLADYVSSFPTRPATSASPPKARSVTPPSTASPSGSSSPRRPCGRGI
jgi:hypothetical protein